MNRKRRWGRSALAVATAAAAMSAVALAAPAEAATTYRFVPLRLTAYDIDDSWPDNTDEIRMNYAGVTFRTNMRANTSSYPYAAYFTDVMRVDLTELDTGTWRNPDDYLGNIYAHSSQVGQEITRDCVTSSAHYQLIYRVEAA